MGLIAQIPVAELHDLTPLVAVCVVFAVLLSVLMTAFLAHLNAKDKRSAELVAQTQTVLTQIQIELTRLADNDHQQTQILQQMLTRCESCSSRPHSRPFQSEQSTLPRGT